MASVYLETTIPSYLTAWPSRSLVAAAHQANTREGWTLRRADFELFVSQLVVAEISAGDPTAAALRLGSLAGIAMLPLTTEVEWVATEMERLGLVPPNAAADAFHVGYAAAHEIDYLLTWNCRHIANAERLPAIRDFLTENGFFVPIICTPEELMGNHDLSE